MEIEKIRISKEPGNYQIYPDMRRPTHVAIPIEVWDDRLECFVMNKILNHGKDEDGARTGPLMPIDGGKK